MNRKLQFVAVAFLMVLSQTLQAQKVKREILDVTMIHYPIVALPTSFTTYSVQAIRQGIDSIEFNRIANPKEKIVLESFKRISSTADLNIRIRYGNLKMYELMSTKVIRSINDLKGRSIDAMIEYTIDVNYEVLDNRGLVIQKETYVNGSTFTSNQSEIPRRQCKATDLVKSATASMNDGINACNVWIRDLFDTYREKTQMDFYGVKPSKTETFEEYATALKNIEEAFKQPTDEASLQKAVQPSLDFWQKKLETLNTTIEDEKSYYFLCSHNLAGTYGLMDDFEKSTLYIDKAIANDFKPGYVGLLKNQLAKPKRYKEKYFADKVKVAENPEMIYQRNVKAEPITSLADVKKEVKRELSGQPQPQSTSEYMEKGFICLRTGDTLFGKFIEFDANLEKGVVSFLPNEGTKRDFPKPFKSMNSMSLRGEVFFLDDNGTKIHLFHASYDLIVFASSKMCVFDFPGKEMTKPVPPYLFFDPNDAASYMTNYKKKLAEVFKERCVEVAEKILKGTYDLKKEGIAPLEPVIRDFENSCGTTGGGKPAIKLDKNSIMARYK